MAQLLSFWEEWPENPEPDPRRLPVEESLPKEVDRALRRAGWDPVDVRTLPSESDHDRSETVKSVLEGIRLGTIECNAARLKFLELEAKICGLLANKGPAREESSINAEDLQKVLDFGPKM